MQKIKVSCIFIKIRNYIKLIDNVGMHIHQPFGGDRGGDSNVPFGGGGGGVASPSKTSLQSIPKLPKKYKYKYKLTKRKENLINKD